MEADLYALFWRLPRHYTNVPGEKKG